MRESGISPYNLETLDREARDPFAWTPRRFLRQHAERSTRRRRFRRLLTAALVLALGFGFVVADGGLLSILIRRWRIRHLEQEVAELESRHLWLERELELRRSDPATIERLAREEYGMIYAGETVVRIVEVTEEEARRVEAQQREATRASMSGPDPWR